MCAQKTAPMRIEFFRVSCISLLSVPSAPVSALHTFGGAGKLMVEISIIGLLMGTCVAFHVIIGDLGPAIISKLLGVEVSM